MAVCGELALEEATHLSWDRLRNECMIKLRRIRWVGHVTVMGEGRDTYMVLVGNSEGKRPL